MMFDVYTSWYAQDEIKMENTSAGKLRAELKAYLDPSLKESIRIQRRLLAMANIIDGETSKLKAKEERLKRFKK